MTQEELEAHVYEELKKPFPNEALKADKSRWNARENKGIILTSVTPQYITDRLNTVLGLSNWSFQPEFSREEKGVLCFGTLTITIGEKTRTVENVGYAPVKTNLADSYKGASTDCLGKCASHIGVADDVFKGLVAPPEGGYKSQAPEVDPDNLGDYVCQVGKQKGKMLKHIDKPVLDSYVFWADSQPEINGKLADDIKVIKEYLKK
jgi:hypothetical protein